MKHLNRRLRLLLLSVSSLASLAVGAAYAQVGGGFDLSWSKVAGGGGTYSTGGGYSLGGTVGQHEAGSMSSGAFSFDGGFWAGVAEPHLSLTPTLTPTPTAGGTAATTATGTPTQAQTGTPPPTQTPGGPTPEPSATYSATSSATSTEVAVTTTPTQCAITFTDVPPGSPFYDFVRCLACRDILSGYADGTFRPGANITRGQMSKIVSNAAGFGEQHPEQTFEDVPVGSTFHIFAERLASRGIVAGYACGAQGEPCIPPDNRPYFRPSANMTRGQSSKIVAIASGLPAPPAGRWTFQDVPDGSTFWTWIETLAAAGVISGYSCGSVGEPCVPPENRPYFRPGNNVTRGQASKIVANAFFPSCQTP